MNLSIIYILVSVIVAVLGQLLLKKGMADFGPLVLALPWDHLLNTLWQIIKNPYVFIGLFIYGLSTIFWLIALSRVDLSYAYPFVSLSYGIMLIAAWLIFHENLNTYRLIGTLIICLGVLIISRG
jgi:drug/metabolite transporter (DMT)-like permease